MSKKLIESLNYWKKKSFIKDCNLVKGILNHNNIDRYYCVIIKNNKIESFTPHKCLKKDVHRVQFFTFFLNKILTKFTLNDCFLIILASENCYNRIAN